MRAEPQGLIEVGCALCGASRASTRFSEGHVRVQDCDDCGLTYITPRLTDDGLVSEVYDERYWRSNAPRERGYSDYRGAAELYRRSFRRRWSGLARRFAGPATTGQWSALDVGCAAGYFLDVLSEQGWRVQGVEPSAPIALEAQARHGAEAIHIGTLESLPGLQQFDLITLWDVLEHLPDPLATLRAARARLAPGGTLVVETQNIASAASRLLGRRWHHFKHEEHLVHFNRKTLRRAFDLAGLTTLEMSTKNAGKYVSGDFIVERSARLSRALPLLLGPLKSCSALYVNLGDELIAIAQAGA